MKQKTIDLIRNLPVVAEYETQEGVGHPVNGEVVVVRQAISRDMVLDILEKE